MFYSVFVLGKKGPLARVWLAAHWDKKITKAQILETNIVESVDSILQPKVKLSLRTSSHLLLGIVRIYARKTLYLLQDCQDAAFKIKSAFRPGVVDLPDGKTEAAISAITLPEMFDFINDFDINLEPQLLLEPTTTANIRNITLAEDISSLNMEDPLTMMDQGREWSEIGSIGGGSINIKDGGDSSINDSSLNLMNNYESRYDRPALDDGFGGQIGVGIVDDVDDVFGVAVPEEMNHHNNDDNMGGMPNGHDEDHDKGIAGAISSRPNSRMSAMTDDYSDGMNFSDGPPSVALSGPSSPGSPSTLLDDIVPFNANAGHNGHNNMDADLITDDPLMGNPIDNIAGAVSQNTMVLEPIDSQLGGLLERRRKRRKKIGMVIDEVKTLSGEEMKAQLSDTTDIITNLDLAPPNKMLMNWKKTGLSDKLFSLPERTISAKALFQFYSRNLITSRYDATNEDELNNMEDLLINPIVPEEEHAQYNGHHQEHPGYNDLDQSPEMAAPKTPRAPKSPAPPRKKRKTEDKENKEVSTKRPRESRYEKNEEARNHVADRSELMPANDSNVFQESIHDAGRNDYFDGSNMPDTSEINEHRAGSNVRGSTIPHMDDRGAMSMNQSSSYQDKEEEEHDEEQEEEDDIFDFGGNGPMSVGPMEEMLPDETADQFEERIRTKRSNLLLKYMGNELEDKGHIQFSSLVRNNKRKMVSQKFYALLVLKKSMAIELYQNPEMPYSELTITKGLKFDEHMVSSA